MTSRLRGALESLKRSQDAGSGDVLQVGKQRLQQLIRDLFGRAGVSPRGLHNLRHSCGTRLYRETKGLLLVARHLGHSTTKTAELYAQLDDEEYEEAVEKLEKDGVE